jgi:hypothetical protein
MTSSTYRAVQAVRAGRLELTEKTLQAPVPGMVRIRVEAGARGHSIGNRPSTVLARLTPTRRSIFSRS